MALLSIWAPQLTGLIRDFWDWGVSGLIEAYLGLVGLVSLWGICWGGRGSPVIVPAGDTSSSKN